MKKQKISYLKGEMPDSIQQITKEYIFEYFSVKLAAKEITQKQLETFLADVSKKNNDNDNAITAFSEYRKTFCGMFDEFKPLLEKKKKKKITDDEYFGKLKAAIKSEEAAE